MPREKIVGVEIGAAGVAHARDEGHVLRHAAIHRFSLHRAAGIVRLPVPILDAVGGHVAVPAQGPSVGVVFFLKRIVMIGN